MWFIHVKTSLICLFTFVLPQLWRDVAVSSVVRDCDGQDVAHIWSGLGWERELDGVPHHPKRLLRYLVFVVDRSWLQLRIRGNTVRGRWSCFLDSRLTKISRLECGLCKEDIQGRIPYTYLTICMPSEQQMTSTWWPNTTNRLGAPMWTPLKPRTSRWVRVKRLLH